MKKLVKTAAGTTVMTEVYSYTRKAQFTGKLEIHTGIKSTKVSTAFHPIIDGRALLGIYHTNAENVKLM